MCEYPGNLMAWLDQELPQDEAAEVERHVQTCKECRGQLAHYEQVSRTFDAYCAAAMAAKMRRSVPGWVPLLAGAGVALAVLLLAFPRSRVEPPPVRALTAAPPRARVGGTEPAPRKTIHGRHAVPPVHEQAAEWVSAEPAVQIAIPAEAMFPPGAVPEGMNFIAELSIAPDGSVERLRLRP
jgi:anti-sigma factor RsiW